MIARISREQITVGKMIAMHCRANHVYKNGLCESCHLLQSYAANRAIKCRFGDHKPVCVNCPVHCYKPEMREKIREVMRYSGPRMIYNHPYLAIMHMIDKNRFKKFKTNE